MNIIFHKISSKIIIICLVLGFFLTNNLYESYDNLSLKNELLHSKIELYKHISNLDANDIKQKKDLEDRIAKINEIPQMIEEKKPAISQYLFIWIFFIFFILYINSYSPKIKKKQVEYSLKND